MRALTLNPGSSSLKAALVADGEVVRADSWDVTDVATDHDAVRVAFGELGEPEAISVRFVHGGSRPGPVLLDEETLAQLEKLSGLAPLHQPLSLDAARLARGWRPGVPLVGCFDTSFHSGLPAAAARYALPREWTAQGRLRRYGFHGLSCQYAARRCAKLLGSPRARLLCCHIGSGVSVTAIRGERSFDTSMGFTPLDGAVMATRSGSVDPGLLLHVLGTGEIDPAGLADVLYHHSGLAGMTGTSGDLREILAAREAGDEQAAAAVEVFLHRLRREMGAVAMSLDRLDAIVFTGGVAEHRPGLLGELVAGLGLLGVTVDPARVDDEGDRLLSPDGAAVRLFCLRAREELELARGAELLLGASGRLPV
ncbi:acetate kinase [Amycolatopsis acidicola]|uniref:Acetate kinase n=1 Tax=Amycolatopsis acidicola TaxID=2596893 RepID=A0A5N0UQU7_9PSEU|nr:acetate kinase [Amycolatopsis acidicola]KAA9153458.1 acetate kinase [Amycolatopsis acidicola]